MQLIEIFSVKIFENCLTISEKVAFHFMSGRTVDANEGELVGSRFVQFGYALAFKKVNSLCFLSLQIDCFLCDLFHTATYELNFGKIYHQFVLLCFIRAKHYGTFYDFVCLNELRCQTGEKIRDDCSRFNFFFIQLDLK